MKQSLNESKTFFVLEGNIGAGKSTFLEILNRKIGYQVLFEPTDKWQDVDGGGNLLDLFYKNKKRWAYTFQSYAFITRVEDVIKARMNLKNNVLISERSVYCDRYCFAKNCFEDDNMTALEWQIYKQWFNWLMQGYMQKPDGFVYLRVCPQVCYKRLIKRDRSEEIDVSVTYLEKLHKKHEDWLINKKELDDNILDIPVLVLECDNDFENDIVEQEKHIESLKTFIYKLKKDSDRSIKSIQI
ncbi:deoxynucleoside kinase [Candidatus Babeliales bacterium]|nr:deoxynucleoside kinase [Candidatus Babeliales bacterium]